MTSARPGSYQVVARRFRPRTFEELVGQEAAVRSLQGALQAGEVPHAFLFSGSRGVGKTTAARILARALNCEQGVTPRPCGECASCRSILAGRNADVMEIDAASHNLVDDVRELRERVGFASMGARYKVYILDEVHMLTRSAFNAFLKTLEEPPPGVVFVLATTELHKVPETIRSRCQVLPFRRVGEADIVRRLETICAAEELEIAGEVLQEIALTSRGGMRDAETALERILPVAREQGSGFDLAAFRGLVHRAGLDRSAEVVAAVLGGDARAALHFADEVVRAGADEREALGELLDVLRAVLLLRVDGADTALVAARGPLRERLSALAEGVAVERLDAVIQAGLLGRERIRRVDDRRLVMELTLVRMAQAGALPDLADLAEAVRNGASAAPSGAAGARAAVPAGVPAAVGSAAGGGGGGDLRALVVAGVRKVKPMLGATVEACHIEGPDADGAVHVRPRTRSRMHRDRLASPDVQGILRGVIQEVTSPDVRVVFATDAAESGGGGAPKASGRDPPAARRRRETTPAAPPPPEIERIRRRFDGTMLEPDSPD